MVLLEVQFCKRVAVRYGLHVFPSDKLVDRQGLSKEELVLNFLVAIADTKNQ